MPIILPASTTTRTITAGDLVRGALEILRVKSDDVTVSAEDMRLGLDSLNDLIDSWSNETQAVFHVTRETFTLSAGVGSPTNPATWGTGGIWNSARPIDILKASVRIATGTDFPVKIYSYDDYEMIRLKTLQTIYPEFLYIDKTYPLANVYIYPVPSSTTTINIMSRKPLDDYLIEENVVALPPGYVRALKFNLATDLAPRFQLDADSQTLRIAEESKKNIKRTNAITPTLTPDAATMRQKGTRYNIYRDSA